MKEDFLGDVELREIPIPPLFLLLSSTDGRLLVQIILDAHLVGVQLYPQLSTIDCAARLPN